MSFPRAPTPTTPPATPARVRRVRECLLRNHFRGRLPAPNGVAFRHRATAILGHRCEQAACPGKIPLRIWADRIGSLQPRFTIGAIAGSPAVADTAVPLELEPSPRLPGRRSSARERRMAPSTSRRGKRRPNCNDAPPPRGQQMPAQYPHGLPSGSMAGKRTERQSHRVENAQGSQGAGQAFGGRDLQHLHALGQLDQELRVARQMMNAPGVRPGEPLHALHDLPVGDGDELRILRAILAQLPPHSKSAYGSAFTQSASSCQGSMLQWERAAPEDEGRTNTSGKSDTAAGWRP